MYSNTFKYEFTPGIYYDPMLESEHIVLFEDSEWFVLLEDMMSEEAAAHAISLREGDFVGAIPVECSYNDIITIAALKIEASNPDYYGTAIH